MAMSHEKYFAKNKTDSCSVDLLFEGNLFVVMKDFYPKVKKNSKNKQQKK